jgi:hypothetical protein
MKKRQSTAVIVLTTYTALVSKCYNLALDTNIKGAFSIPRCTMTTDIRMDASAEKTSVHAFASCTFIQKTQYFTKVDKST